jgi:hypothetical protein
MDELKESFLRKLDKISVKICELEPIFEEYKILNEYSQLMKCFLKIEEKLRFEK